MAHGWGAARGRGPSPSPARSARPAAAQAAEPPLRPPARPRPSIGSTTAPLTPNTLQSIFGGVPRFRSVIDRVSFAGVVSTSPVVFERGSGASSGTERGGLGDTGREAPSSRGQPAAASTGLLGFDGQQFTGVSSPAGVSEPVECGVPTAAGRRDRLTGSSGQTSVRHIVDALLGVQSGVASPQRSRVSSAGSRP